MARLILLNGPPGIGKSTLARAWAAEQERAVVVEVDALRRSLDDWQRDERTKLEARRAAATGDDHPEHEVVDVRATISEAVARLRTVADERSATSTISAHDPDRALAHLTSILEH